MLRKKRITIKDIARKAGIAHSTVSRAINDVNVSQNTKIRVLRVIEQLDYQPNLIARGLIKNKTQAIALITPQLTSYVLRVIAGAEDICKSLNYALMLFATNPWQKESLSYTWVTKNWLVDGVLILNILHQEKMAGSIKKLLKDDIPCVFINKYLGSQQVNAVGIDNYDGVTKVVSHLVDLGHKRIGIINGGLMSVDGFERFEAYKKALKQFKLKYNEKIVGYGDFNKENGYEEMKRILCGSFKPTAIFCANDIIAIGAIRAIKEKGLRIPNDIAVVGFDDIEAAALITPSLTTIRSPLENIGAKAIELLVSDIKNNKKAIEEISLKTKLIVRESSGA